MSKAVWSAEMTCSGDPRVAHPDLVGRAERRIASPLPTYSAASEQKWVEFLP
jgi:hypothetical protein